MTFAIEMAGSVVAATNNIQEARQLVAEWSKRSPNGIACIFCRRAKMRIARARNGRIESL